MTSPLPSSALAGAMTPRQQEQDLDKTANGQLREPNLKGDSPMETGEFHNRDGWYFKRLPDGSVRLRKTTGNADAYVIDAEHIIPPNEWASIIAHVAANGGVGANYARAEAFHDGRPVRASDALVLSGAANEADRLAEEFKRAGDEGAEATWRQNAADLRDIRSRL